MVGSETERESGGNRGRTTIFLKPDCLTGGQSLVEDHVLNLSFPGLDSEALMVATKDLIAVSNFAW